MTSSWWQVVGVGAAAVVLAGCTSGHPLRANPPETLVVHVGLFGGPALDAGMADSNAPALRAPVSVVDYAGRTWSARTGRDGIATLSVPTGRYTVSSDCGQPHRVTVVAGKSARVQIGCDIP